MKSRAWSLLLWLLLWPGLSPARPADEGGRIPVTCASLLPEGFLPLLAGRHPRHHLVPAVRALHSQPRRCVNVARGDYDGDGAADIAVLLVAKQGDESVVVVALRRETGWDWERLRTWDMRDGGYVETVPPGVYESHELLFPVGEAGEVKRHRSAWAGVASGGIDSSRVAYFRTKRGWVHLWLSD